MTLLCIKNNIQNPYFNLAIEEYMLKNKQEDVFMLWQNEPTVVVGKHQNAYAEINHDYLDQKNIKIARRLSGGGTVYHDLGNINFTYIMTGKHGRMVDFAKYTDDILQVLHEMNVPAIRNKRNDLIINNKKISGNAEHVFKNRVLHHGTLLFNSELDVLNKAIQVAEKTYIDKAVQSVRSKVANISEYTDNQIDIHIFYDKVFDFILSKYPHAQLYTLSGEEIKQIKKLEQEKYSTWHWIFGYSPKYELVKTIKQADKYLDLRLNIKKGIIEDVDIKGNMLNKQLISKLSDVIRHQKHDKNTLLNLYKSKYSQIENEIMLVLSSIF